MPVSTTKRAAAPAAVAPKKAALPQASAVAPTALVMLVNKCSTYVTPEREIFYATDTVGNKRIYPVKSKDLQRLLSYKDDWNRRFFKQVTGEATEDVGSERIVKKGNMPVTSGAAGTVDAEGENVQHEGEEGEEEGVGGEEFDTGITRLKDADGDDVGTTV